MGAVTDEAKEPCCVVAIRRVCVAAYRSADTLVLASFEDGAKDQDSERRKTKLCRLQLSNAEKFGKEQKNNGNQRD